MLTAPQLRKKCAKANARPPPEAAEMRGFALVLVAFRGEEGQGRGLTRRFFSDFPARGGEASTEIASWELGWRLKQRARGSWQQVAGLGSATISCALCVDSYIYITCHMLHRV